MQKSFFAIVAMTLIALHGGVAFLFLRTHEPQWIAGNTTPQEYLVDLCLESSCDAVLLDAIITCESQWRMVQNSVSSAYGYFQILDSTEATTPQYSEGKRKFDPYSNLEMGVYLYNRWGTSPWNESKHCWSWRYAAALANAPSCIGYGCF